MHPSVAEYWLLKEVSECEGYGTETFCARWIGAGNSLCTVAVSPHGVNINSLENDLHLR